MLELNCPFSHSKYQFQYYFDHRNRCYQGLEIHYNNISIWFDMILTASHKMNIRFCIELLTLCIAPTRLTENFNSFYLSSPEMKITGT